MGLLRTEVRERRVTDGDDGRGVDDEPGRDRAPSRDLVEERRRRRPAEVERALVDAHGPRREEPGRRGPPEHDERREPLGAALAERVEDPERDGVRHAEDGVGERAGLGERGEPAVPGESDRATRSATYPISVARWATRSRVASEMSACPGAPSRRSPS